MTRRRGFVLPTTLMVLTLLTVLLAAAFTMVSSEFRAADNSLAMQRAIAIAEAGLQEYLSSNRSFTGVYDSLGRISYPGGYATVAASRVVPANGARQAVWVVRSYGYATDSAMGGQTQAMRVVGRLTRLNPGRLYAKAAWMSAGPIQIIQGNISFDHPANGKDLCTGSSVDTFAVAYANIANEYTLVNGGNRPEGDGSGATQGLTTTASRQALIDSTHIDWAQILAGNFTPDYDVTSGSWPGTWSGYPVYWVNGDLYLTAAISSVSAVREGILVVRGNIRLGSNSWWRGTIIAGGSVVNDTIVWNGSTYGLNFTVQGSLISGLNNGITANSAGTSIIHRTYMSGSNGIRWGSCYLSAAAGALGSMTPIANGWMDAWSVY